MFIAIEGIDCAGKSTQVAMLSGWLRKRGRLVKTYRDPGDTPVGEAIRTLIKSSEVPMRRDTEVLLFAAARSELAAKIRDDMLEGHDVIVDRWVSSTIAYQAAGAGASELLIRRLAAEFNGKVEPRVTFVLDIAPKSAMARLVHREKCDGNGGCGGHGCANGNGKHQPPADRFEGRQLSFYEKVAESYRRQVKANPSFFSVDAAMPREMVHSSIVDIVSGLLGEGIYREESKIATEDKCKDGNIAVHEPLVAAADAS